MKGHNCHFSADGHHGYRRTEEEERGEEDERINLFKSENSAVGWRELEGKYFNIKCDSLLLDQQNRQINVSQVTAW